MRGLALALVVGLMGAGCGSDETVERPLAREPVECVSTDPHVVSVMVTEAGTLEIVYRQKTRDTLLSAYGEGPSAKVWKDVYCANGGRVVYDGRVFAEIRPARFEPETVEWPKRGDEAREGDVSAERGRVVCPRG